jgi:hypothetical protein
MANMAWRAADEFLRPTKPRWIAIYFIITRSPIETLSVSDDLCRQVHLENDMRYAMKLCKNAVMGHWMKVCSALREGKFELMEHCLSCYFRLLFTSPRTLASFAFV